MKKILLMIVPLMALIGCSYDDTDIQKRLDDLDGQLTELQALVGIQRKGKDTHHHPLVGFRGMSGQGQDVLGEMSPIQVGNSEIGAKNGGFESHGDCRAEKQKTGHKARL